MRSNASASPTNNVCMSVSNRLINLPVPRARVAAPTKKGVLSFESSKLISTEVPRLRLPMSGLTLGLRSCVLTCMRILSVVSRSSRVGSLTLIQPLDGSILNAPESSCRTYLNCAFSPWSVSVANTCSTVKPGGRFSMTVMLYMSYSNCDRVRASLVIGQLAVSQFACRIERRRFARRRRRRRIKVRANRV